MHIVFAQYAERLHRRKARPHTLANLRRTAALFAESGLDPLEAEDWQLEQWLVDLPYAPRTVRLHAENLSAVYGYAAQRRLIAVSPMDTVRLPREPDKEPRILETGELRAVLREATSDQDWLLAHLLMYTGMRRSEIRDLLWEDVSFETGTLTVMGKGGKLRKVPLHPALSEALMPHEGVGQSVIHADRSGRPVSDNTMQLRLDRIKGEVSCTYHDFRRTVATSLAENEVPERIIDKIMGWAPRTVASRYYVRAADYRMQEAILRLYADDPL